MEACHNLRKFIPKIYEENTDINTTLFVFIQIVSENVGLKKLLVNYLKRDGEGCIFDGIQDLLKSVSIELELTPMDIMEFYELSSMDEPPHIFYVDDLLEDPNMSQALINSLPPMCYLISREVKDSDVKYGDFYYLPLYKIGKGKDKLELARWKIQELWRQIEIRTRISVVVVRSESDLEDMRKSLKAASIYHQLIIVTKYPDEFGIKAQVLEHRKERNERFVFVVLTNSEVDEKTLKSRIKGHPVCSVFNDGVWGGEYFVPTQTGN